MKLRFLFILLAIGFVCVDSSASAAEKYFHPVDFGAKEGADQTQAIQAAIDAAIVSGGGTVVFPVGRHLVRTVCVAPGITLLGEGGVVRRPARWTDKDVRTFVTGTGCPSKQSPSNWAITYRLRSDSGESSVKTTLPSRTIVYNHSSDFDSAPLVFRKMIIDGNRLEQGAYANYEQEHNHLVVLSADPTKRGRLNVLVEDSLFFDGVADGLSVYVNTSLVVRRSRAYDIFRGGIVVTGGNSKVVIENFVADGAIHNTGIDVELAKGGFGYGGTKAVDIQATDVTLKGDFDVGLPAKSRFKGQRIRSNASPFNLVATESQVEITDSVFTVGGIKDRILRPGSTRFTNVTFVIKPDVTTVDALKASLSIWYNNEYSDLRDQTVIFDRCRFVASPTAVGTNVLQAISVDYPVKKDSNNQLIVEDSAIGEGFRDGLYFPVGGDATITNTIIRALNPIVIESDRFPITKILVDGVSWK